MMRANLIFVTTLLAVAACAKPKSSTPATGPMGGARVGGSDGPSATSEAGGGAPLDWSTVPSPKTPAKPCVLYPATGQYLVCLASDPYGCIHFGDLCTPSAK